MSRGRPLETHLSEQLARLVSLARLPGCDDIRAGFIADEMESIALMLEEASEEASNGD